MPSKALSALRVYAVTNKNTALFITVLFLGLAPIAANGVRITTRPRYVSYFSAVVHYGSLWGHNAIHRASIHRMPGTVPRHRTTSVSVGIICYVLNATF